MAQDICAAPNRKNRRAEIRDSGLGRNSRGTATMSRDLSYPKWLREDRSCRSGRRHCVTSALLFFKRLRPRASPCAATAKANVSDCGGKRSATPLWPSTLHPKRHCQRSSTHRLTTRILIVSDFSIRISLGIWVFHHSSFCRRSNVITHSKCLVWGKRSNGCTLRSSYPAARNAFKSRIWVAGLQET